MGCWHELCVVSGIYPGSRPGMLIAPFPGELKKVTETIAGEVEASGETNLGLSQLTFLVAEALKTTLPLENGGLTKNDHDVWWIPYDLFKWHGFDTSIAIGHFDENGEYKIDYSGEKRKIGPKNGNEIWPIPNGVGVEVRRVRKSNEYGGFDVVVVEDDNVNGWEREQTQRTDCCARFSPNFFVLEGCYRYLEEWLDPSVSPAVPTKTAHGLSLPLAGELYEIIHSRKRDRRDIGFPEINYGGIEKTCQQWQDYFMNGRKGSRNISRGIAAGLRGKELIPCISNDFRCWMFMRPDSWPYPPSQRTNPIFLVFSRSIVPDPFTSLPTEILLNILHLLPLSSLFALSSASKSLRNLITDPSYLKHIIKEAILEGGLRWVLPIYNFPGEEERALAAIVEWMPKGSVVFESSNKPTASRFISSSAFPHVSFIRACCEEGSMLNRKRLWDNVKQFDLLWRDYRLHGWRYDRFRR